MEVISTIITMGLTASAVFDFLNCGGEGSDGYCADKVRMGRWYQASLCIILPYTNIHEQRNFVSGWVSGT